MPVRSSESSDARPMRIPVIGILVDRRTDILAAATFLLALLVALMQAYSFIQGARVSFVPPDRLFIILDPVGLSDSDERFVHLAAEMGYFNSGKQGYDEAVRNESVSFELQGQKYTLVALAEYKFSDENHDKKLEKQLLNASRVAPIQAGSAVSRQMYFAPHSVDCETSDKDCKPGENYLSKDQFLSALNNTPSITFSFSAELISGQKPQANSCKSDFPSNLIDQLDRHAWIIVPCWLR